MREALRGAPANLVASKIFLRRSSGRRPYLVTARRLGSPP
jgi:hypothetical protein